MHDIVLRFPGRPHAQQRHRRGKHGNYDPDKDHKAAVRNIARTQLPPGFKLFHDRPLFISLRLILERPGYHYKASGELKADAPILCYKIPDYDNYAKFYGDALEKVVWKNDGILSAGLAVKMYGETPETILVIMSDLDRILKTLGL